MEYISVIRQCCHFVFYFAVRCQPLRLNFFNTDTFKSFQDFLNNDYALFFCSSNGKS